MKFKPEGKFSVKINTDYNVDCDSDETYDEISQYFSDINNVTKRLKNAE